MIKAIMTAKTLLMDTDIRLAVCGSMNWGTRNMAMHRNNRRMPALARVCMGSALDGSMDEAMPLTAPSSRGGSQNNSNTLVRACSLSASMNSPR